MSSHIKQRHLFHIREYWLDNENIIIKNKFFLNEEIYPVSYSEFIPKQISQKKFCTKYFLFSLIGCLISSIMIFSSPNAEGFFYTSLFAIASLVAIIVTIQKSYSIICFESDNQLYFFKPKLDNNELNLFIIEMLGRQKDFFVKSLLETKAPIMLKINQLAGFRSYGIITPEEYAIYEKRITDQDKLDNPPINTVFVN